MAISEEKISFRDRLKQIGPAFTFVRRHDKLIVPLLLATFLVPILLGVAVCLITGGWLVTMPLAVMIGVLLTMIVFTRRVAKATYSEVEGQPGAAAAVLQNMRGDWRITPGIAATPQQDVVHRVIGRPGVILLIEGSPTRLKNLIVQEKKRVGRVAPEIPVYDITVGDDDGQVPLRKLQTHFIKMPRNITPKQINALENRLQALGAARPPLPKGPLPKGARMPKGAKLNRKG
jgi:hypothetical protein